MAGPALRAELTADAVVWHDLECGSYHEDMSLWLELAALRPGPVLDVGAGTGRVALALARAGHVVQALDHDAALLGALQARALAAGLDVGCLCADACTFSLAQRFGVCLVPMQTVHMLPDRAGFLRCAFAALRPDGLLAVALLGDGVEPFEMELEPDRAELGGVLYESYPTALRMFDATIVLERRRERTDAGGRQSYHDVVRLAELAPGQLSREAAAVGFAMEAPRLVEPTEDRAGSMILVLRRRAR